MLWRKHPSMSGVAAGIGEKAMNLSSILRMSVPVAAAVKYIWACNEYLGTDQVYELSTDDLSIVRSASSPSARPYGIGGDAETIWHTDSYVAYLGGNSIYELSVDDFSVVRSGPPPQGGGGGIFRLGIGGKADVIWYCESRYDRIHELSTTDLSSTRYASSPSSYPFGIGGDSSVIWHCDDNVDRNYELSTTDFSSVRYASTPGSNPSGIGGDSSVIWHCDYYSNVWELSTSDFSIVKTGSPPGGTGPSGIGGG